MSTDKTQADVQPGGRVRLGDQAERARFEAWNRENWPNLDLSRGPLGDYMQARVRSDWQLWQAAQPSPGGQGEALASLPLYRLADDANGNRGLHRDDTGSWVKLQDIERALAARQPVEFERAIPTRRRESAVELLLQLGFVWNNQRWEDRRQPVGWQPMESAPTDGTVVLGLLEGSDIPQSIRFRDGWEIAWDGYRIPAHDGPLRWVPLYAATPAQQPAQVYLDGLDRALGEAIDQRDRYHEMADDLAGHIAAITGVDIGEHSSANCPWQNAIEAAEEYKPAQAVDLGHLQRVDPEIHHDANGAYGEMTPNDDGEWVRFSDVESLLIGRKGGR